MNRVEAVVVGCFIYNREQQYHYRKFTCL